jgi:hypothetical protein
MNLKACSQSQPSKMSAAGASGVDEKEGLNTAS